MAPVTPPVTPPSSPHLFTVLTPPGSPGAVAIIQCTSPPDAGPIEPLLGLTPLREGDLRLADLFGLDRALVARIGPRTLQLMPHGGRSLLRALTDELTRRGLRAQANPDPAALYPEASTPLEARLLHALAQAASPRAIDVLLDQPQRFAEGRPPVRPESARALARLLHPPLIVAVGPSNVGKSTLLNTLAGRHVALVADEPGTTRDHVGARLDLAGLVVRYADAPGLRDGDPSPDERRAVELALELLPQADLVLHCADATQEPRPEIERGVHGPMLRVHLRADRDGPFTDSVRSWAHLRVCAHTGEGIPSLVAAMADALVPRHATEDPGAWEFWKESIEVPAAWTPNPGSSPAST